MSKRHHDKHHDADHNKFAQDATEPPRKSAHVNPDEVLPDGQPVQNEKTDEVVRVVMDFDSGKKQDVSEGIMIALDDLGGARVHPVGIELGHALAIIVQIAERVQNG